MLAGQTLGKERTHYMDAPVILFADLNDEDLYTLRLALLERNLQCDLRRMDDGQETIDYLNGTSQYSDRETFPFPVATILDFQLPMRSGLDVLAWVRRQQRFKDHPVLILSTEGHEMDEARALQLQVTRCFRKSAECKEIVDFLERLLPRTPAAEAA